MSSNDNDPPRPTDAPLPPWTGRPDEPPPPANLTRERGEDEDVPTLTQDDLPVAPPEDDTEWVQDEASEPEPEDPRALARRLAAEAKRRLAEKQAQAEEPEPDADTSPIDAEQVEAATAPEPPAPAPPTPEPATPAEDPRELARRLAAEAKERMGITAPPAAAPLPDPATTPDSASRSLAARAGRRGKMSAADALNAARVRERTPQPASRRAAGPPKAEAPPLPPLPPAPTPAVAAPPAAAAPVAAPPPDSQDTAQPTAPPQAPLGAQATMPPEPAPVVAAALPDPAEAISSLVPKASVDTPLTVTNVDVFRALWRAHRTRALHEGDVRLAATASVLLDAVGRLPAGQLVAARITVDDQVWAVWADIGTPTLLGAAQPADIYLAGL